MDAAQRVVFGVTHDVVTIEIDGETRYSGGVDELRTLLDQHERFMGFIDSHREDGYE